MNETANPEPSRHGGHRRRRRGALHRALMTLLAIGIVAGAVYMLIPASSADALGFFGHGPRCHHGRAGRPDVEAVRDHTRVAVDRILDRIDASDGQREVIVRVVDRTLGDLFALRAGGNELREELLRTLSAPSVERSALEDLRRRKLEAVDRASTRIVDAIAEIAEVLSQQQRRRIADHIRHRHG